MIIDQSERSALCGLTLRNFKSADSSERKNSCSDEAFKDLEQESTYKVILRKSDSFFEVKFPESFRNLIYFPVKEFVVEFMDGRCHIVYYTVNIKYHLWFQGHKNKTDGCFLLVAHLITYIVIFLFCDLGEDVLVFL